MITPEQIAVAILMQLDIARREALSKSETVDEVSIIVNFIDDAVRAERKRCVGILQRAREGDIDGDLRALISRINHP